MKQVTICSIYMPNFYWKEDEIARLIDQFPPPILLVGDFNAHNSLCGSERVDPRGRELEKFLSNSDLILLNDGSGTFQSQRWIDVLYRFITYKYAK